MLNCQNPTIAIIDSGIGGASILRQLIQKYKVGNYIYYADNLYMPYGNKSKDWIQSRLKTIIGELQNKYRVDYIIIACNTASANISSKEYKNVITMRFNKSHTYFATNLTKKTLKNIEVISDSELAEEIETNIFNKSYLDQIIKQKINQYKLNKIPTLVLGCTHYELVKSIFEKYCFNTKIINNSSFIIDDLDFKFTTKELNVYVKTSRNSKSLKETILKLIN